MDDIIDDILEETPSQAQINAMVEAAKNPQNAVRLELSNRVSDKLRNDKNVSERVDKSADKVVDAGLTAVENEADKSVMDSSAQRLEAYFNEHKEELKTAGIENPTYMEDMETAVKWHKKCAKLHWRLFGWWMTLIRTFILKAKPFRVLLNLIGILLNLGLLTGLGFGIAWLIKVLNG